MAKYTIKSGDTLYKIASRLSGMKGQVVNDYVAALVSINDIADKNKIYPGQVLQYPNEWKPVIDIPMGPPPPPGYRTSRPVQRRAPSMARPAFGQGGIMTMLKNPLVLGAIAIGAILFITTRKG